jgi:hypothetical protein
MILRILGFVLIGTTVFSILGCVSVDKQVKETEISQTVLHKNLKKAVLHLKAEVEPKVVEIEGELRIRLIITNTTDELTTRWFYRGCQYGCSLRDENGELEAPPLYDCRLSLEEAHYSPGQVVKEFKWVLDDEGIKPGGYQLVVGFGPLGEWDSAPPIEIEVR